MVVAVVVDAWIVSAVHAVAAFVVSGDFVFFSLLLLLLSLVVVVVVAASAAVSAVVAATAAATAAAAADAAASKEWVGWIFFQRVFLLNLIYFPEIVFIDDKTFYYNQPFNQAFRSFKYNSIK